MNEESEGMDPPVEHMLSTTAVLSILGLESQASFRRYRYFSLSLNLFWTAMQLAVPAPLRMGHQAEVLDQALRFSHDMSARCLMRFSCCSTWVIHRTVHSTSTSRSGCFLRCRGCLASTMLSRSKASLRGWQPSDHTELCREEHRWLLSIDG